MLIKPVPNKTPFFEGCKFHGFRDFLKIHKNFFHKNQILMMQDGRWHKFVKIKSVKLIFRQIHEIYSPLKKAPYGTCVSKYIREA